MEARETPLEIVEKSIVPRQAMDNRLAALTSVDDKSRLHSKCPGAGF
jgi:hypothetical protein